MRQINLLRQPVNYPINRLLLYIITKKNINFLDDVVYLGSEFN